MNLIPFNYGGKAQYCQQIVEMNPIIDSRNAEKTGKFDSGEIKENSAHTKPTHLLPSIDFQKDSTHYRNEKFVSKILPTIEKSSETQKHREFSNLLEYIDDTYSNLSQNKFHTYNICITPSKNYQIPASGLNFITKCNNCQLTGNDFIIFPSGLFPERNGYCGLDREIHKMICPKCGKRVKPDPWLSVGFYQCKYRIIFQTNSARMKDKPKILEGITKETELIFAKCYPSGGYKYLFLDVVVQTIPAQVTYV